MSDRWKYQIITGSLWGIFMTIFNVLFESSEKPIAVQLSSYNFYMRAIVFILVGIFILAYYNWKEKMKRESNQ